MLLEKEEVREVLARVRVADPELGAELQHNLNRPAAETTVVAEARAASSITFETIVLRPGRPVLAIRNNQVQLDYREVESGVWKARLTAASERLSNPIRPVGRIDLVGHPQLT